MFHHILFMKPNSDSNTQIPIKHHFVDSFSQRVARLLYRTSYCFAVVFLAFSAGAEVATNVSSTSHSPALEEGIDLVSTSATSHTEY
ncbi:hypothetical protein DAPPUDRAFT_264380 [Daphnia pulex]|uniref:Uncharacterized protein n=1 Tax=Daphnia pulex TaxID=6669 RepID=E9HRG8_DAPPU|nr:hypothetical protein DAPPUDRAFT_264380 [Daphnia pulex]|eukprot:EFX65663.1 hypothetical protein DAPPUDRAFT_264380 [Daphnia pulex]